MAKNPQNGSVETVPASPAVELVNRTAGLVPPPASPTFRPLEEMTLEEAERELAEFANRFAERSIVFTGTMPSGEKRSQKLSKDAKDGTDAELAKAAKEFTVGFTGKGKVGGRKQLTKKVSGEAANKEDAERHMLLMIAVCVTE